MIQNRLRWNWHNQLFSRLSLQKRSENGFGQGGDLGLVGRGVNLLLVESGLQFLNLLRQLHLFEA